MAADTHDPLYRMAQLRVIKMSAELEAALAAHPTGGVAIEILRVLRDRAAEAMVALVSADITDIKAFIKLRNEVMRYDEWFVALREIVAKGKQYDQEISREERESLLDILVQTEEGEREAIALGLVDPIEREAG